MHTIDLYRIVCHRIYDVNKQLLMPKKDHKQPQTTVRK